MGKFVSNFLQLARRAVESPETLAVPYFNDQMGAPINEGARRSDAFPTCRALYDEWVESGPSRMC